MRIAMWSGPRNLSTALMYAFAARGDCAVLDEPFYAPYLAAKGIDHPMRDAIIAAHERDAGKVGAACAGPIPEGKAHLYLKLMPHQMLAGFPQDWMQDCVHVHLIRHPARVIASYGAKRSAITLDDIGYRQQAALFAQTGGHVIDSSDIRENPARMLRLLCELIGLDYRDSMLHWAAGGHKDDGIWASHWYGAIHQSTGFAGPESAMPQLSGHDAELAETALPYYEGLARVRIG